MLGLDIVDAIEECEKEHKFQFRENKWRDFRFELNNKQIYTLLSHFITLNEYWTCEDIIIRATKHWKHIMKKKNKKADEAKNELKIDVESGASRNRVGSGIRKLRKAAKV